MLHHVELYVSDLERALVFWTPLMERLGYEPERWSGGMSYYGKPSEPYLCLLQAPQDHLAAGYHRKRVGLNHLAFHARDRAHVDELLAWATEQGHSVLYSDRYPEDGYYALFLEDPDRIKIELVAPGV